MGRGQYPWPLERAASRGGTQPPARSAVSSESGSPRPVGIVTHQALDPVLIRIIPYPRSTNRGETPVGSDWGPCERGRAAPPMDARGIDPREEETCGDQRRSGTFPRLASRLSLAGAASPRY